MNDKILVIDDSKEVRENVSEILGLANYRSLTAKDGIEGLELARKHHPALVLCDVMMPKLDGYGVLKAIENIPEMIGTPFIFLTAKAEKKDFRIGMNLGADDYLTKPFKGDELLKIVDARLKKSDLLKKKFSYNLEGLNSFFDDVKLNYDMDLLFSGKKIRKVRKKEMIFIEGDLPNYLYFIVSGKIKTFKTNESGKEYITAIYKEGEFFGHMALLENEKQGETAVAIESSEIALVPKEDFYKLLFSNPGVSYKFIKFISNNLREAEERMIQLAYNSARKRIADALLFLYKKFGGNKEEFFPVQRENISAIAGISIESVSRALTDFRDEGLIESKGTSIRIIDLKKLQNLKN